MSYANGLVHSEELENERQAPFRLLAKIREPFKGVPTQEIEHEVARAIAEVRRERRAGEDHPAQT